MVDGGWLVCDDIGVGVGGKVVDGANNPNKKKLVNHGANIRPCINVHRHENSDRGGALRGSFSKQRKPNIRQFACNKN